MKVIILAGGWGTRLGNLTESIPKPMVRIGNKPLLWHIMKIYSHYGFNDFIISLGYKSQVIKNYFYQYEIINNDFVKSYDHKEHKTRLVEKFIDKGVPDDEKPDPAIIACRAATMGRLSELKLVDWSIDENGWSQYKLTSNGEKYLSSV